MSSNSSISNFDAIVIGAGFSGIYSMFKLTCELGFNTLGIERGENVGGTWYWNRYPGVQADTDSFVYRYSFDQQVSPRWDLNARYQNGSQIRDYIEAVSLRHGITPRYQFKTVAKAAEYLADSNLWRITTDAGQTYTSRYLISAAGVLSSPVLPNIENLGEFGGRVVHTARWPDDLKLDGLRVGVLGTGSTGAQVVVATSRIASHVTVFQRSAQYIVPAGQRRLDATELDNYLSNFHQQWSHWRETSLACGFDDPTLAAFDVTPEEREAIFERAWRQGGGFGFMFGTFNDLAFNPAANRAATEFIVRKIRQIVHDPKVAERLIPDQPYAKRPVSVDGFYETFNQPNVKLVALRENPIMKAVTNGVITADGIEHELDVLILATGFEAVEGAYRDLTVIGRNGRRLSDEWKDKPSAFLGISTPKFPNFFTVLGPQGIFSNLPPGIETQVDFITDAIRCSAQHDGSPLEARSDVLAEWSSMCTEMANGTLFAQVNSWIFGTNVHDGAPRVLFFFGGLQKYREILDSQRQQGFPALLSSKASNIHTPEEEMSENQMSARDLGHDELRRRNYATVERYMHTKGQDRLKRHELFVPDAIGGLWTTETGLPIEIHGKDSLERHAHWSLQCFPDWEWFNIQIYPGVDPNFFWVECDGQGAIRFPGYPDGHYENHFIFSFELREGMITRSREFMNPALQMRALGIPVPTIRREGIPQ